MELAELQRDLEAKSRDMKTATDDLRQMHTELKAKMEGKEFVTPELKEAIDKAMTGFNGLRGNVEEIEQKLAARVKMEDKETKSWGQQVVESEGFKSFSEKGGSGSRTSFKHELKQVTSAAAGGLIRSVRDNEIVELKRERRVVRDLMNTIAISTSSVDYPVQLTRTNSAAPVAESAAKPYSDYTWGSATVNVRTLAHLAKLTRQAIDDAPRLIGEVDSEMRYGLGYVEERQFLYGNGTGQNLTGIVPQATAFAVNSQWAATMSAAQRGLATAVDVLRLAALQTSIALLPADGFVLNEADWAMIELTKTTDGAYLFANPQGQIGAQMWGLPVVATPAMILGTFLTGSFRAGATVYDRMGVEVLISTENDKDFENNLATMRAEERVALAVKRPGAFVTGTISTALTAMRA